jgi:hypothetical protein
VAAKICAQRLMPQSVDPILYAVCEDIHTRMSAGRVIPFLGAGANLYDRVERCKWNGTGNQQCEWRRQGYLPSGRELACYLAGKYGYPERETDHTLSRVAQYVDLRMDGEQALFEELRATFNGPHEPNGLHRYLAEPAGWPAQKGTAGPWSMIVTTNYDDTLERAFREADQDIDVVYYSAARGKLGHFRHILPNGDDQPIRGHNSYNAFELGVRPVILKLHGGIERLASNSDSYVITEDHYIAYGAAKIAKRLPACLLKIMVESHFLFLGYSLGDWNLRVVLHRIWSKQKRRSGSWAIQRTPNEIDKEFWRRNGVRLINAQLNDWVEAMRTAP